MTDLAWSLANPDQGVRVLWSTFMGFRMRILSIELIRAPYDEIAPDIFLMLRQLRELVLTERYYQRAGNVIEEIFRAPVPSSEVVDLLRTSYDLYQTRVHRNGPIRLRIEVRTDDAWFPSLFIPENYFRWMVRTGVIVRNPLLDTALENAYSHRDRGPSSPLAEGTYPRLPRPPALRARARPIP